MKTKYIKIIAGITALVLSSGFTVLYAKNSEDTNEPEQITETNANEKAVPQKTSTGEELTKNETVYVNADANGNTENVTVSDWISNPDALPILDDVSDLSGIINVKGSEAYSSAGNNVTWQAAGSDIYYQGTTDKNLPVQVSVSYTLDGNPVTAAGLAGKSGKVKIRFDYSNDEKRTVEVNGKNYTVTVPFAAVTGLVLDSEKFTNIEVTNGKVVSDGSKCIIVGGAFPGLYDSLALDSLSSDEIDLNVFDIPDYFEITADAADFSLETSLTVVTNEIFNELGFDPSSTADELKSKVTELKDASDKLKNGTSDLYDGLAALLEKSGDLKDGVSKLADGTGKLNDAASKINDGAAQISSGTGELKTGAEKLKSGTSDLSGGISSLKDGTSALKSGASALNEGTSALADGASSLKDGTGALLEGASSLKNGTGSLSSGASELNEGAKALNAGTVSLDEGAAELRNGLDELSAGFASLTVNSPVLLKGSDDFYSGLLTLKEGLSTVSADASQIELLVDSSSQIKEAVTELTLGAEQLKNASSSEAMKVKFAENGLDTDTLIAGNEALIAELSEQTEALAVQAAAFEGTEGCENELAKLGASIESLTKVITVLKGDSAYIDASLKYTDGLGEAAGRLSEGTKTLKESYEKFDEAVNGLAEKLAGTTENIGKVKSAVDQLAGSYETLGTGFKKYIGGVNALNEGCTKLTAGAEKLSTGTKELKAGAASLSGGAEAVSGGASTVDNGVASLLEGINKADTGAASLAEGASAVNDGSASLLDGITKADDGTEKLLEGSSALDEGTGTLLAGIRKLFSSLDVFKNGTSEFASGASELNKGMNDLKNGSDALIEGVGKLYDGSSELKDGMKKFDEEGIEKIANIVNNDLAGFSDRIAALKKASEDYTSFAGKSDSMKGSVKFVIETDRIGSED